MKRIAVVGSANMDLVVSVPRFLKPGETLLGASYQQSPGGKGANQAVVIGRLGGRPYFIGNVGDDAYGVALRASFRAADVDVAHLSTDPANASGVAFITVDNQGENMIAVCSGANLTLTADQVRIALQAIQPEVVLCQLEISMECVMAASETSATFILNPAPAQELSDELLSRCDLLTPNETEVASLAGLPVESEDDCRRAAGALLDRGVKAVLITRGSKGCYYRDASEEFFHAASDIKVVDSTGAGDAFNGALARFWDEGIREAVRKATIVAGICATRVGAQESMPLLSEAGLCR